MTKPPPRDSELREQTRVDFAEPVSYRLFQEFITEYAGNISTGGMFLKTIHPQDPGTEVDFEFRLEDGYTLVEGKGEVAWVRETAQGPDKPPGMGLRFIDLPDDSWKLVRRIVEQRLRQGGEIFDLRKDAPETEAPAPPPSPAAAAWPCVVKKFP